MRDEVCSPAAVHLLVIPLLPSAVCSLIKNKKTTSAQFFLKSQIAQTVQATCA